MAATASKAVKRVYVVTETLAEHGELVDPFKVYLVRAGSQAAAVAHIVRPRFTAAPATTEDVLRLRDVEVQDAGAE